MKSYLFLLLLFLQSCILNIPTKAQSKNLNHSNDKSFKVFWVEFREAVIKDDTAKLITLAHFPLKVHGNQDEDSIIYLSTNNFIACYKKFLLTSSFFENNRYITNFEYITNNEIAERAFIFQETATWKRVGDLEFEKIKNQWRLTLFYCPR